MDNSGENYLTAKIEINLGIISNIIGDYETAFSYYRRALLYFEKIKDLHRIAEIRHNLGMFYTKKKNLKAAIKEFDKSILSSMQCGDIAFRGLPYLSKAYIYTLQNDLHLADAFATKALEICSKINDKLSIADIYKIKGIIQRKLKSYDLAENYLLTSLRLNTELQNKLNQAETSLEIGRLYKETGRINESKPYFDNAIKYFRKIKAANELASIVTELSESV
jgi:tetratricopeptide (TPR) repeat protein